MHPLVLVRTTGQILGFCHLLLVFTDAAHFPHTHHLHAASFLQRCHSIPQIFPKLLLSICSLYLKTRVYPIFPPRLGRGHSCSAVLISPVSQHSSPDSSGWFSSGQAMPQHSPATLPCFVMLLLLLLLPHSAMFTAGLLHQQHCCCLH